TPEDVAKFQAEDLQPNNFVMPPATEYCIPISAHIVRTDAGTGGISLNQLYQGIQDCNSKYTGTGLHFVLYNISYIDDDDFYYNIDTNAEIDAMLMVSPVANTVNVYCTPNLSNEDGGLCGRGSFTTSSPQGIALNNGCVGVPSNDSSFPHELGHYFDLFHTHETAFGAELVDGSNCSTAGDKLCDTPADPGLDPGTNVDNACNYYGSETDGNGDHYNPDTHQLMSYAPKLCRDVFSPQSRTKIVTTLLTKRAYLLDIGCPPVANAGNDITAECAGTSTTSVKLDGSGSSDPDGDPLTYKWSATGVSFDDDTLEMPTGSFHFGTTTVRLIVFDGAYPDTDYVDVTIEDTTAPVISCPIDTTVECSSHCGVAKTEIASWLAEATATDLCEGVVSVTNDAPDCFPDGETTVTFSTHDAEGNPNSCTAKVTVVDTTPPKICVDMDRNCLWPPNHKLVEVCADVDVKDICDPNPTFVLYSVNSSEPENDKGDGNTDDDIQGDDTNTADLCFSLRSERRGGGDGRTYTIIYQAMDASGNVAYDTTCVKVPHDMSGNALCAYGFVADGTALQSGAGSFAMVIPGTSTFNVGSIDVKNIYVGNTASVVRASDTRHVDVNNDGKTDLAVMFNSVNTDQLNAMSGTSTLGLYSTSDDGALSTQAISDGPVGLHFATLGGGSYLVSDIYVLGTPVEIPTGVGKKYVDPEQQGLTAGPATSPASAPNVTGLSSVHPNPFNPSTTVDFSLANSGRVTIAIYDVRGMLVRRLVDETMPSGAHQARWNGMDDRGRPSASGIYFVRMLAGSYSEVRKIVMLK
ncbi:MAG TPA: FlgD immunoglobulin-like domain containing protein, partial [Candidatus Krumholzibacteria bacterium]|nr:FlgD immunoglobulin-like domain containing protein [Candidatus Krumholzibacteria bacterium]